MLASLIFISVIGWAETKPTAYVICKNGSQVRTVRVELDAEGVCHTIYSKQGAEKGVGSGKNKDSCMQFLNNIRVNLEKSNWKCRDVEAATVDESST
jgi:hypothetical protein